MEKWNCLQVSGQHQEDLLNVVRYVVVPLVKVFCWGEVDVFVIIARFRCKVRKEKGLKIRGNESLNLLHIRYKVSPKVKHRTFGALHDNIRSISYLEFRLSLIFLYAVEEKNLQLFFNQHYCVGRDTFFTAGET